MGEKTIDFENGLMAEIQMDQDCERPYSDDDAVRIVVLHRRYLDPAEGKCGKTPEEVARWEKQNARDWYVVPLWLYDHSGTVYRVGGSNPFSCPWDSGRAGIIALKKDEWGKGKGERNAKRFEYAQGIAEEYTKWANGECYGYVLHDADGEELDSCWGFIGMETAEEEAREAARLHIADDSADRPGNGARPGL